MVNLFQRSEKVADFLEEAIALKASVFWMQLGIVNKKAGKKAADLGMVPVMDRCMKIEYARLFGGLTWSGVNTGVISAKRPNKIP